MGNTGGPQPAQMAPGGDQLPRLGLFTVPLRPGRPPALVRPHGEVVDRSGPRVARLSALLTVMTSKSHSNVSRRLDRLDALRPPLATHR